jgi:flavorubredoxin
MSIKSISEDIIYVGVDDATLDLFESQYKVPEGVSYNSYVIKDRKIAVMDTVDQRATDQWFDNIEEALSGKAPDYLVISHLEPDHSANIQKFLIKYPDTVLVGNARTFAMLPQFFAAPINLERSITVGEADTLNLGQHVLQFFMAPMVHWPEVMVTYDQKEKILFSADAFGKFGILGETLFDDEADFDGYEDDIESDDMNDAQNAWLDEARRYYINIVGKHGLSVQGLLKKIADIDIRMIAPLHGPVLRDGIEYYIGKYQTWSTYVPENDGVVIAYASIHGNTAKVAKAFAQILREKEVENVLLFDLSRCDGSEAVARAYQYDKLVLAGVTYDAGLMPCMQDFLYHLKHKNFQNRRVAIIENGSWAPVSGKLMHDYLAPLKNVFICEKRVTIKSTLKEQNLSEMEALADELLSE